MAEKPKTRLKEILLLGAGLAGLVYFVRPAVPCIYLVCNPANPDEAILFAKEQPYKSKNRYGVICKMTVKERVDFLLAGIPGEDYRNLIFVINEFDPDCRVDGKFFTPNIVCLDNFTLQDGLIHEIGHNSYNKLTKEQRKKVVMFIKDDADYKFIEDMRNLYSAENSRLIYDAMLNRLGFNFVDFGDELDLGRHWFRYALKPAEVYARAYEHYYSDADFRDKRLIDIVEAGGLPRGEKPNPRIIYAARDNFGELYREFFKNMNLPHFRKN